jgi:peptidoglycan/LPS O-acetylase OafA/YrhL/O-antigen/teichoic acid export membrane protein
VQSPERMARSTPPRSSTLASFISAAARHVAGALAGFVLIPVIAHALGAEALGAWTLLGTCSFLLGIADLGLSTCVQRAVAAGDDEGARRLVSLSLAAISLTTPLLAGLAFAGLDGALSASLGDRTTTVVLVALAAGAVGAWAFPYRGFLLVKGGMRTLAVARGVGSVTQVLLTIALMGATRSLLAPALALLLGSTIETAMTVLGARRHDRALPLLPAIAGDRRWAAGALREGSATLAINASSIAAQRIDVLLLAAVAPLPIVAAYGVVSRVVDQAYVLAKQVSAAVLPRLAVAADRPAAVRLGTRVMGVLVASGMPALAIDGGQLLVAWGGPTAGSSLASTVLLILGAAAVIAASQEVAASALTMAGASAWQAATCLIAGTALNVGISLVGARFAGPVVIAAATVAGNLLTAALIWKKASALLSWGPREIAAALTPLPIAALAATLAAKAAQGVASGGARLSFAMAALSAAVGLLAAVAWTCWPRLAVAQRLLGGPPMAGPPLKRRSAALDIVRGLAVLLVLVCHADPQRVPGMSGARGPVAWFFWRLHPLGSTGVDLFFVLSGFLVSGLLFDELARRGDVSPARFWGRRAFKILPSYLVLLAVLAATGATGFPAGSDLASRLGSAATHLLFAQNYLDPERHLPTWSLAVEEHFYLLLPLALMAASRLRRQAPPFVHLTVGVMVACLAMRVAGSIGRPVGSQWMQSHLRFDALFFGVLVQHLWRTKHPLIGRLLAHRGRSLLLAAALIAPSAVFPRSLVPMFTVGLTALAAGYAILLVLVLGGALAAVEERAPSRALAVVGRASYNIYLWHYFLAAVGLPFYEPLVRAIGRVVPYGPLALVAQIAAFIVVSVGVGLAFTHLVELPVIRLRDRMWAPRRPAAAPSAALVPAP